MPGDEKLLTVSWSRLKTFDHCRAKAKLQSQGIKSPSTNLRVFFRGTVTDRILRDWIQDPDRDTWKMSDRVDEFIQLCEQENKDRGSGIVRWKSGTDKAESSVWCQQLLDNSEPLLRDLVIPYFPDVYADKHLKADIIIPGLDGQSRKIRLIGILDILIDSLDMLAIHDLKATENENYYKQTIMQLVFYWIMVKENYGRIPNKTSLIQPMCKEKIKSITVTDEHVLNLMNKIVNYAHAVWKDEMFPKESDAGCLTWCEVSHACSKFKKDSDGKVSWL